MQGKGAAEQAMAMARRQAILEQLRPDQRFLDSLMTTFRNHPEEEANIWLTLQIPDVEFNNASVTRSQLFTCLRSLRCCNKKPIDRRLATDGFLLLVLTSKRQAFIQSEPPK